MKNLEEMAILMYQKGWNDHKNGHSFSPDKHKEVFNPEAAGIPDAPKPEPPPSRLLKESEGG